MKTRFVRLLDVVFGCRHPKSKRSWPRLSLTRGSRGYYQKCNQCGQDLPYHNDVLLPDSEAEAA